MDDNPHDQHAPDPPSWPQYLATATDELRWLLKTTGIVALTLALGRLMQKLGLDLSHLTTTSWQELVKHVLQQEKKKQ